MAGKSESPKFNFPHYGIGDLVRTNTGHMMVTEHEPKGQGYIGHHVNEYGETKEPKSEMAVLHEDVGTGKHHLYAKHGDYPKTHKQMNEEQHEKAKTHPKYEKLKSEIGKRQAIEVVLQDMNNKQ